MAVKSSGEHAGDPGAEKGVSEGGAQPRARWANKMEFFLCASTQICPLHSMWNFPFLFHYHGGGIFLIPYCFALFFCGMPLLFLGLALGQYTSQSGVTAWKKICPMFQGVGVASMVILVYLNLSVILMPGWSLLYLYSSFKSPLPWTTCDNWWNTERCTINTNPVSDSSGVGPLDDEWMNTTSFYDTSKSAGTEFWRSINPVEFDSGKFATPLHWSLIPCLFIVWILCYFCTWKGIKWTGKVIYTITFAYLLLIVLFFRAVSLPGAGEGLKYLFTPNFRSLSSPHTWLYSVTYALFFASSLGLRTPLGSYNKYNNDCYRDCLIFCALHVCTIIFVNCLSFSFVGFVANIEGVDFNEAMDTGVELLFVTFPKALSVVAGSTFWTVLLFLMSFLLTLSQQVVLVECLATNISDLLPRDLRKRLARELLVLAICGLYILLGLFVITKGGQILLQLVDSFGLSTMSFYFIVCFETIVISWVYGADRFYDNITDMIGYVPFPVPKYCWLFITPLTSAILLLISLGQFYPLSGRVWQNVLGFILMATSMMCIPVFMLISLCRSVKNTTTPSGDLPQTRPHKPALTLCKRVVRPGRAQPEMSDGEEAIIM